jgi:hypothetical protein
VKGHRSRTSTPKIVLAAAAALTVSFMTAGSAQAATSTSHAASAQASTAKASPWTCTKAGRCSTCTSGAKLYIGAYRVFDNAWAGQSSKHFCVSSTGLNITIRSEAIPFGGNVVAYPSIRFGAFYTDRDPHSGLPERVIAIGAMTLNVASRGNAAGTWLTDADIWFRPRARWERHGAFELVIAHRWHFAPVVNAAIRPVAPDSALAAAMQGGRTVRIRGVRYGWNEWVTTDPQTGLRWPILVFRQLRQWGRARIRVGAFVWFARHHGAFHLPRSWWLGDVAYGSELWSGGKGLTDSMRITGLRA